MPVPFQRRTPRPSMRMRVLSFDERLRSNSAANLRLSINGKTYDFPRTELGKVTENEVEVPEWLLMDRGLL